MVCRNNKHVFYNKIPEAFLNKITLLLSVLAVFIVGCGGSNSGKEPIFLNNGGAPILGLEGDFAIAGETVGLVLNAPESDIKNIIWSQLHDIAQVDDFASSLTLVDLLEGLVPVCGLCLEYSKSCN